jgi:conjugative transposon TraM protein
VAGTTPVGFNYAVQPGQLGQRYDLNADPNVAAMQTSMQRLQAQTSPQLATAPVAAPAVTTTHTSSAVPPAAAVPATRMDASLKELDELKSQYQKRLLAMNSPVPAVPVATAANTKKMTVITHVRPSVVSLLQQTTPATNGFHTVGESGPTSNVNAVPAVIHNDQVVEQGSTVKLRLLEDVQLEGPLIPRNSFLYGTCSLVSNRLTIAATLVQYKGNPLPVNLKAFDIDGNEEHNIPGSLDRDALKQGAAQGVSSADMLSLSPSLGAQAASIVLQTGRTLTSHKIKTVKIHLKANYQLLLKS